ncbi:MAG: ATP-binding cassette domain-containing protein [Anaerolineales bacterium]|nr:ATP-binding cassette domain-containing protein [Anaerolineales bacterium]
MIRVASLVKEFQVVEQAAGVWGMARSLVAPRRRLVRAVDDVSFEIAAGELVGYLGPNGAGKSTTIKMLTGLLVPTAGELVVNGRIPWRERQRYVADIGVVFGQRTTLWWDLPVIESLELLQHIYRVPAARFRQNLATFTALLDLGPFLQTPVRALSLGQRMRADICAALLHDPAILFLDEPTIGLDVVAKERIRQFIRHVNAERGTTVILTTHDLQDVERLCARVMIIDSGRLLFDGALAELRRRFDGHRELVVDLDEAVADTAVAGAEVVAQEGLRVTYRFRREEISASALIGRVSARCRIRDLAVREPDIEATIRRIYEGRLLAPPDA